MTELNDVLGWIDLKNLTMDFIDTKYINLISIRFQKFKKVNSNLYNFRCPLCGDSQKNKNKARGYFYQVKNNTNYKCHNCGVNISFNNFLKEIDISIHKQYVFEKFKEGFTGKNFTTEEPKLDFKPPIFQTKINLPKASENKIAKEYLLNRKLDPDKFYYAEKFKEWVNSKVHTFDEKSMKYEESRIIIPLVYKKSLIGFQGRALGYSTNKYITVMLSDDVPKIYGFDKIDESKSIYIVEGPFDSTFIQNSVAMCGSDIDIRSFGWCDYIYVYDNEPRNREIVNRISKTIDSGDKVVIWPRDMKEKDINDLVLSGHNVMDMLKSNTYSGLESKIKFNNWKKI